MLPASRALVRRACAPLRQAASLQRYSTDAASTLEQLLGTANPSRAACCEAIAALSARGELPQAQQLLELVTRAGISLTSHSHNDATADADGGVAAAAPSPPSTPPNALGRHPVRPLQHVLRRLKPRSYRMYTKLQASRLLDYVRAAALAGAPVSGELHSLMIRCFCRRRETSAATALVRGMVAAGIPIDATLHYHPILRVLSDSGRAVEARELLREMRDHACLEPDATAYMLVVEGLMRARDYDAARLVLLRMLQLGLELDERVLRALVCGFCDALQSHRALAALRDMIDVGVSPDRALFYRVLDALGHAGNLRAMRALLDDMTAVGFDRVYESERLKQLFSVSFADETSHLNLSSHTQQQQQQQQHA